MLEPVGFGPCNFESNIQEKETASEVVQYFRKKEIRLRLLPIEIGD